MAKDVFTDRFSEPLNGATTARIDLHAGDGNLVIDRLTGGERVLASGDLQYLENQGLPTRTLEVSNGRATLTLRGAGARRSWLHLPWAACNGATEWQIHLNPGIASDIAAHSDGGNVTLDLNGMAVTRVSADTGGGNLDLVLPEDVVDLSVMARTGAGNVDLHIPGSVAARIHATTGLGKMIVDPRFGRIDANTYQSPDYDRAGHRVEITASSGAGNVSVDTY